MPWWPCWPRRRRRAGSRASSSPSAVILFGVFSWKWWFRDQLFLSAAGYLILFAMVSLPFVVAHVLRRDAANRLAQVLDNLGVSWRR